MANDKRTIYFNELIVSNKGNMQALFKMANKIFDKNSGSRSLPQHDNATSLADQFNNFYSGKVQEIRKKIPKSNFEIQKY